MPNIFFTADTHFNHTKILAFEPMVRDFDSIQEHDEELIKRWNARVRPSDTIWHLGDVYLGKDQAHFIEIMKRLNGKKHLVRGNHDTFHTKTYLEAGFDGIYGVWPKYDFVMSHTPLHPDSVDRWKLNVHGHLHSHRVTKRMYNGEYDAQWEITDGRYFCVSVEQHGLTPVSLDEIRKASANG